MATRRAVNPLSYVWVIVRAEPEGEVVQERRVGLVGDERDRVVVDHLDVLHRPERHAHVLPLAVAVVGVLLEDDPREGVVDRACVEGVAVVELDALAQLEGPGQPVVGNLPGLGQLGLDVHGVLAEDDQVLEHLDAGLDRLAVRGLGQV